MMYNGIGGIMEFVTDEQAIEIKLESPEIEPEDGFDDPGVPEDVDVVEDDDVYSE